MKFLEGHGELKMLGKFWKNTSWPRALCSPSGLEGSGDLGKGEKENQGRRQVENPSCTPWSLGLQ